MIHHLRPDILARSQKAGRHVQKRLLQQCIGQLWKPPPTPASPMPAPPTPCADGFVDDHCHTFGNDGLNGSDFIPVDTSSGSEVFVGRSFSLSGQNSDEEPGVWGLDAKMQMRVGAVSVTVKQHTEGRLADSRPMANLCVDGLVAVDNVGGWLEVDGALAGGQAPVECVGAAFSADRPHPPSTPGHARRGFYPSRAELDEAAGVVRRCEGPLVALHVDAADESLLAGRCES